MFLPSGVIVLRLLDEHDMNIDARVRGVEKVRSGAAFLPDPQDAIRASAWRTLDPSAGSTPAPTIVHSSGRTQKPRVANTIFCRKDHSAAPCSA
jgi:hypothetical protein